MPELPEVETICRDLNAAILGRRIKGVEVRDRRVIRSATPDILKKTLVGNSFKKITRRGKALIFELARGPYMLVIQPMMTGQLVISAENLEPKTCRIVLDLEDGQRLYYNDQRVFGRWQIIRDTAEVKYLRVLGPEPLADGFTAEVLSERISGSQRPIKPLLLDHAFIAGIGNIYASEILFKARIDPRRPARSLRPEEIRRLWEAVKSVLKQAVRLRGSSVNTYVDGRGRKGRFLEKIRVYQKEGDLCPDCGEIIRKTVQAQRSTFFCSNCQQ
ncbi:MAG TPA: DNA-formamidopyrimidine glycosylase [Candidatus Omnitrophota bacterium]|jgi:formamidopyrimidine-DNA glycosylase|nr:DNA-formamidopyrimidine glycosylase [Candidatus Omnitrophota bacterium]HSA30649.1 DNA-formamidopyrimidine glycosylase [Candidatus Omnitrophota bacterium]